MVIGYTVHGADFDNIIVMSVTLDRKKLLVLATGSTWHTPVPVLKGGSCRRGSLLCPSEA